MNLWVSMTWKFTFTIRIKEKFLLTGGYMLFSVTRSVTFALLAIYSLKIAAMIRGDKPIYDSVRGLFVMISALFAVCALASALMRI